MLTILIMSILIYHHLAWLQCVITEWEIATVAATAIESEIQLVTKNGSNRIRRASGY